MEFRDLPLHPLIVHAVVVLVPLAVLAGWAVAVLPGWRWLMRWVAVVLAPVGTVAVVVSRASGEALLEDRPFLTAETSPIREVMATHQDRAGVLLVAALVHLLTVVLAFVLLPAPTGLASGRLDHRGHAATWIPPVLGGALVVTGAVLLVWVALTGDAGARAVWGRF